MYPKWIKPGQNVKIVLLLPREEGNYRLEGTIVSISQFGIEIEGVATNCHKFVPLSAIAYICEVA